jgi:hypothetical protein
MSKLQESLRSFLAVEGVRTAALIDIATGMIVRSVGKPDPDLPVVAERAAEEVRAARSALGPADTTADLMEITVTTGSRLQVSRILQCSPSDGLLLFVDLERAKSNLGLASVWVDRLAPAVLA